MRKPVRHVALAASLVLVVACGDAADPGTTGSTTSTGQSTSTSAPATTPTTAAQTTTTDPGTTTTTSPAGWSDLGVDPGTFEGAVVTDAATADGVVLVAGCDPDGGRLPLWRYTDGPELIRAEGPVDVSCVDEVDATRFGWFARGQGELITSDDGASWTRLDLAAEFGYEFPGQLGYPTALFASPDDERFLVLFSRAAEAESTVATLAWTDDGTTWTETPLPAFDSSTISAVVSGGDGLLAAGASPGGQFVPTAAIFTSEDGLEWRRVTPSGPDYTDKVIEDVRRLGDTFVAVGGDYFETGLMTAWTSPDGIDWTRSPHPDETTDASVASMTALQMTSFDDSIWAAGIDFDARRPDPQTEPALWRSEDGVEWTRIDLADVESPIPFEITAGPDFRIGVWPPPGVPIDEGPVLFGGDPGSW